MAATRLGSASGDSNARQQLPTERQSVRRSELVNDYDWAQLRHARSRHDGFSVGRYLQPPPMLFTRDGHNLFLGDMYRGRCAFLVAGGPSLIKCELDQLNRRGVLTCAVNNAAAVYRPQLWVSVDDPGNFVDSIWRDPGIMKFVPLCHMEKHFMVRDEANGLVPSDELVGDMPAVFGYRRNEHFREQQWLYEDTFNWGNHSKKLDSDGNKGSRSVMYVAIRMLFYLGIRRLYLLGCDFRMEQGGENYAFPQERSPSSVRGNNESYYVLNQRLTRLLPYFDREGFEIVNCTPNSGLTVFPYVPFDSALQETLSEMPRAINTSGMYDRKQHDRDMKQQSVAMRRQPKATVGIPTPHAPVNSDCLVPDLTVVTAVDRNDLAKLVHTWPTWLRYRPEFASTPVIVIHDDSVLPGSRECDFLREHPQVRFIHWRFSNSNCRRENLQHALVMVPAREVATPWYLKLDVNVVATDCDAWLRSTWFAPTSDGRPPVFVASPRGSAKAAEVDNELDDWANSIPGLQKYTSLALTPTAERLRRAPSTSWCFFGDIAWTREVAAFATHGLPCSMHSTYMSYCALRRGDPICSVELSRYGWQHSNGSERKLRRLCDQLARA